MIGRECHANANTIFYSDDPVTGLETFPIDVPPDITILGVKGDGNNHPRIGIASAGPAFKITDASGVHANSSIERFGIFGGDAAIRIEGTSGNSIGTTIKKITFSRNKTAIEVYARNGSVVRPTIQTCTITDVVPSAIYPPVCDLGSFASHRMDYGIRFKAEQLAGDAKGGAIEAQLINLNVASTATFDKGPNLSHYRRLIDVEANGNTRRQHELQPFAFDDIARVDLEITACSDLDGGAGSGSVETGWNYGVYASAGFADGTQPQRLEDYASRFRVTFIDCVFHDFRRVGIYGEAGGNISNGFDTRAQFEFNPDDLPGSTGATVTRTGSHLGSGIPTDETGTGILLNSGEAGYASLNLRHSRVADNWNDGVRLIAAATDQGNGSIWPSGSYLTAHKSAVESNRKHGFNLEASGGSVGSTWHGSGSPNYFRRVNTEPVQLGDFPDENRYTLPYGMGVINACSINNNGLNGTGDGINVATTGASQAGVAITNNIIWNNVGIGVRLGSSGVFFCPVVHCTIAGNNGGMNMEVGSSGEWMWKHDPFDLDADPILDHVRTGLYDNIFEMKSPAAFDFGINLMNILRLDASPDYDESSVIYGEANRAKVDTNILHLATWYSASFDNVSTNTPFAVMPPVWTSADASQLFLAVGTTDPGFFEASFWTLGLTLVDDLVPFDYSVESRPQPLNEGDKGADELP